MKYLVDWDSAPIEKYDGHMITVWLDYWAQDDIGPLPRSGYEDGTYAHENEEAWDFVDLPSGVTQAEALATMTNISPFYRYNKVHDKATGKFAATFENTTPDEMDMYQDAQHYSSSLTPEERTALSAYQTASHRINDPLRAGEVPAKYMDGLDGAIAKGAAHKNMIVYRGVRQPLKAKRFQDNGYVSTTTRPSVAHKFAEGFDPYSKNIVDPKRNLMAIEVPKGHKIAWVSGATGRQRTEAEVLLPRGSKFTNTGRTVGNGIPVLRVS